MGNRSKENVLKNIENMKRDLRFLQTKLNETEQKNRELEGSQLEAEEKCDLLEEHLNRAAKSAEAMNQSFNSSNMSIDRIHLDENYNSIEDIQRLKEELAELKKRNQNYISNLNS